jgi:hypothetical protein
MRRIDLMADVGLAVLNLETACFQQQPGAAGELHLDDRVATTVGDEDTGAGTIAQ